MVAPSANATAARRKRSRHAEDRLPHRIEAELISALGMGPNLDIAAADQSRPSATRAAKLIHPMRSIFIPRLGKIGLAYFSPSECEVAHTSRDINGGSGGHRFDPRTCSPGRRAELEHFPSALIRRDDPTAVAKANLGKLIRLGS